MELFEYNKINILMARSGIQWSTTTKCDPCAKGIFDWKFKLGRYYKISNFIESASKIHILTKN